MAGAIAWIAALAAGFYLFNSERQLTERRTAERAFDLHARETVDAANEVRTAQQAYVAAGQGVAFWVAKVANSGDSVRASIRALRQVAGADAAKHALDDAARSLEQFVEADKRALDYINASQPLMAADVIFTEGGLAAADAARYIEQARVADLQHADALESSTRRRQATAVAVSAVMAALVVVLLIPVKPRESAGEIDRDSISLQIHQRDDKLEYARTLAGSVALNLERSDDVPEPAPSYQEGAFEPAHELKLTLRDAEQDDELRLTLDASEPSVPPAAPKPIEAAVASSFLKATAELATDFGRVRDMTDLHKLVARTASLMDANGVVLWVGSANGAELRPLLTHGYTPHTVARLTPVSRSASNAAAAAFRSGTLQIVESAPDASGAIVAPILTSDGCIGALAAELNGGEASERVQTVAAIASAHLAAVLTASGEEQTRRAAAG